MNPSTLNNVFIRDIFEGYLTYMNVDDTNTTDVIALRDLYAKMRTLITYHDMDSDETWAKVLVLKNQADAIETMIAMNNRANAIQYTRATNEQTMTVEELDTNAVCDDYESYGEHMRRIRCLNPDLTEEQVAQIVDEELEEEAEAKRNPSPQIWYCGQQFPSFFWKHYATIKLKFLFDEDYQRAYLDKENLAEIEAKRRELDERLNRITMHEDLRIAMFCCAKCFRKLSNRELDEKAIDMYYDPQGPNYGYSCICADCHEKEEQQWMEENKAFVQREDQL